MTGWTDRSHNNAARYVGKHRIDWLVYQWVLRQKELQTVEAQDMYGMQTGKSWKCIQDGAKALPLTMFILRIPYMCGTHVRHPKTAQPKRRKRETNWKANGIAAKDVKRRINERRRIQQLHHTKDHANELKRWIVY